MTSSKINGWCHAGDFSFDFSDRKNPVLHVVFHISENEERNLSVRIKFDRRKRTKISIKLEFQQLILLFPYGFCRLSRRDLASLIIERADFLVSFFNDLAERGKLPSDFSESGSSAGFHRSKDSDGSNEDEDI